MVLRVALAHRWTQYTERSDFARNVACQYRMQIVTDRCRLCDPWLVLLLFGARNPRHETTFYAALGVRVGIAADQCGVGFEPVFDIGSQRLDGDM